MVLPVGLRRLSRKASFSFLTGTICSQMNLGIYNQVTLNKVTHRLDQIIACTIMSQRRPCPSSLCTYIQWLFLWYMRESVVDQILMQIWHVLNHVDGIAVFVSTVGPALILYSIRNYGWNFGSSTVPYCLSLTCNDQSIYCTPFSCYSSIPKFSIVHVFTIFIFDSVLFFLVFWYKNILFSPWYKMYTVQYRELCKEERVKEDHQGPSRPPLTEIFTILVGWCSSSLMY